MVALGDPQLPDPFEVQCAATGKGRWADPRNWVYDFDEDLPARPSVQLRSEEEREDPDGKPLEGAQSFAFSTGGPAVIGSYPRDGWSVVDEEQVFLLKLDAPATLQSVQAHARCMLQGVGEEIPVEVLTGAARQAMLKERKAWAMNISNCWKSGGHPGFGSAIAP